MKLRTLAIVLVQAVVLVLAASYGLARYLTDVPGIPYGGAPPALAPAEIAIEERLRVHVATLAARERNLAHPDALESAAKYVEQTLAAAGFATRPQIFTVGGREVRNIEVIIEPAGGVAATTETVVVGAHYDSAEGTPGADDNATGVAALIELIRQSNLHGKARKRVRFVFFVNEEAPYFKTDDMGSRRYARALAAAGERVTAMYALESLGYYSEARGSQRYPALLGLLLPDRGDFVAFVGALGARDFVRETVYVFRSEPRVNTIGGVMPGFVPGVDWSDHWAFAQEGWPAVMITDTAPYRNPHYHRASDTPDTIDYRRLTHIVRSLEAVIAVATQ